MERPFSLLFGNNFFRHYIQMLKYLVEFLGTFLFLSVIVATGQPVLIALALLAVILLGGAISGGHFNPAVSVMFWAKGALTNADLAGYVISQGLGGLGALAVFNALTKRM
jgi:glycerol uptake facilitator-like aquaporin